MRKIKGFEWMILLFNIIYLLIFTFLFLGRKNYEFLLYIGVVAFFLVFISLLHLKYNFNYFVLIGLSLWGLLHMFGGYFIVGEHVLYGYQIFPFLRYDMFVHAFGFGFATLFSYYILKPNLKEDCSKTGISILLIFIGMGLGAVNEIVEFIAVLLIPQTGVGGYENTMWDIVFNTFGAILAVIWINLKKSPAQ
ncbi:MAG: hypothetical protein AABW67_02120 [Nanoarchaeota archaeon]